MNVHIWLLRRNFSVRWITCCSIRRSWNVSCRRASSCLLQRKLKTTSFLRSSINHFKYCYLPITSLAVLLWIHSLLGSWLGPAMTLQPLEVLACFPLMHTPEGQQYYCYLSMPEWSRTLNLFGWRWCCFFDLVKVTVFSALADSLSVGNASTGRNSDTFRRRGDLSICCIHLSELVGGHTFTCNWEQELHK